MKRRFILINVFLLFVFTLCSCKNSEEPQTKEPLKVYGGDIIRYYDCISEDGNLFSFPVIINQKVENISINSIVSEQAKSIELEAFDFNPDSFLEHNNYYTYFLVVRFKDIQNDIKLNTHIEKLLLDIDNEVVEYNTPYFQVCNSTYLCNDGEFINDKGILLINSGFTGIYGYIPTNDRNVGVDFIADRDITILSYELLDYLTLQDFKVDGKEFNAENINLNFGADNSFKIEHFVELNDDTTEDNIIKTSMVLKYQAGNEKYIWIYPAGVYIWKDYTGRSTIKSYIDNIK